MPEPEPETAGYWVIADEALVELLQRAADGEDPGVVMVEAYLASGREHIEAPPVYTRRRLLHCALAGFSLANVLHTAVVGRWPLVLANLAAAAVILHHPEDGGWRWLLPRPRTGSN